ncbi:hypothetical protein ETU08_00135 [Apibacter muscae]|uniref:hypothetical protein n=1 Tax=Apibacter muscae TaxID=2509004 RepID=UPI0011ADADFD|nr:hypothetical protein [Apibacter muscae]TWP31902.1 hypothetical protein ETU08_00135 [Apibacter muscae]
MKVIKSKRMNYSDIAPEIKKKFLEYYLNNSNNSIPTMQKKFKLSYPFINRIIEEGRKDKSISN